MYLNNASVTDDDSQMFKLKIPIENDCGAIQYVINMVMGCLVWVSQFGIGYLHSRFLKWELREAKSIQAFRVWTLICSGGSSGFGADELLYALKMSRQCCMRPSKCQNLGVPGFRQ